MKINIMNTVSKMVVVALFLATTVSYAQIAVGTSAPHASAALDVESTTAGFLPPRMNSTQRDAISSPANGLLIYNSDKNCLEVYTTYWRSLCTYGNASDGEVLSPTTGLVWKDRNLGATQVATSSTDAASYGDLYQWGRAAEGHESRSSLTSSTKATTATPNDSNTWDGLFIIEGTDWLTLQDDSLWQGLNGTNNPCPTGFRLPTKAEWQAEVNSWSANSSAGAFDSPLKLSIAGYRTPSLGSIIDVGSHGYYWSSTVNGTNSDYLGIQAGYAILSNASPLNRNYGLSVRCLKN